MFALANPELPDFSNRSSSVSREVDSLGQEGLNNEVSSASPQAELDPITGLVEGVSNMVSTHKHWSFNLSNIREDLPTQEVTITRNSQQGISSWNVCAVPGDLCEMPNGESVVPGSDLFSCSVQVCCATVGCNYGGPLHQQCLQRWNTCCELRCRILATQATSSNDSQPWSQTHPQLDAQGARDYLSLLFRCPQCGNDTLCRISTESFELDAEDPHANVMRAMQYVTILSTACRSASEHDPSSADVPVGRKITGNSPFAAAVTDPRLTPGHRVQLDRHYSCGTEWPTGQTTAGPRSEQKTNSFRRYSLHQKDSIGGTNSSGLGSSIFTNDSATDFSRRSSQNTDSGDVYHTEDVFWSHPGHGFGPVGASYEQQHSPSPMGDRFTFNIGSPHVQTNLTRQPSFGFSESDGSRHHSREMTSPASGLGRRHSNRHPSMSFWPTDNRRSTPSGPDRKVVNPKGNIFKPRPDFNVFEKLPEHKRSAYFIHLDDDSCTGNEDTRAFLLAQLTNHRISTVSCIACNQSLQVYDHFPVLDGLFFISPVCHRSLNSIDPTPSGLRITWHTHSVLSLHHAQPQASANTDPEQLVTNLHCQKLLTNSRPVVPPPGCLGPRQQMNVGHLSDTSPTPTGSRSKFGSGYAARQERYLHALCLSCVEPDSGNGIQRSKIVCRFCGQVWSGSNLVLGGLYTYDVFAAAPCCAAHLTCNSCGQNLNSDGRNQSATDDKQSKISAYPLPFFSQYSQLITCLYCQTIDYHFVKPFAEYYRIELIDQNQE